MPLYAVRVLGMCTVDMAQRCSSTCNLDLTPEEKIALTSTRGQNVSCSGSAVLELTNSNILPHGLV